MSLNFLEDLHSLKIVNLPFCEVLWLLLINKQGYIQSTGSKIMDKENNSRPLTSIYMIVIKSNKNYEMPKEYFFLKKN